VKPEPFRINPIFSHRLWGKHSLAPIFPEEINLREPIGEAWLTDDECCIASGPLARKLLDQAWREIPPEWRGTRLAGSGSFPLLVKFIFPNDKLSIQVHPDDAYAAAQEQTGGGRGKTETWHVVSAEPGARVLIGLKRGVDKKKFLEGLQRNALEDLFEALPVHAGDTFFVPAGTPHTIGPNMVICEIQQYSDLTYRVYDYGRVDASGKARELHIEKALEVIRFGPVEGGKVTPLSLPAGNAKRSLLAACRYFAAERWECSGRCEIAVDPARFEILVILDGEGTLAWADSLARYHRGECWIVPASQGRVEVLPETPSALVRSFIPDVHALRTELYRGGIPSTALSQVIFD
jgi:mannose-6-phosphate isomerase